MIKFIIQNTFTRRTGKLIFFTLRGNSIRKSWWLSSKDAPYRIDYRNASIAELNAGLSAVGNWSDIAVEGSRVYSKSLNLSFHQSNVLSRSYAGLKKLAYAGAHLKEMNNGLILLMDNLQFRISTNEDVEMANEILLDGCYNLKMNGIWSVIDVGANAGMASILFASQPWCEQVFAFEPFAPTIDTFIQNLSLNQFLENKIQYFNIGLGSHDHSAQVEYAHDLKGSMTTAGLGEWRGKPSSQTSIEDISIRRATLAFNDLTNIAPRNKILVKMDCEGSEYEILNDLEGSGWLGRIDAIIMEWHNRNPDQLCLQLSQNKFNLWVRPSSPSSKFGLLLAWKE